MVRKAGGCLCWAFTRALLDERHAIARSGATSRKADLRNFYYEVRNRFLRKYPNLLEFDTDAQNVYAKFEDVIKHWCRQKAPEYGIDPALWWRVREMLNLWATGKAVCWKKDTVPFPVMNNTRKLALSKCSFLLVCEKRTVGDELMQTLSGEGYHLNIIATVGHSQSDVQEAILAVEDAIEDVQNFYVLILHDYDLDGVRIYQTLRQRHPGIIDVGVNGELLQWIKKNNDFDPRLLEERCLNKKYQHDLKRCLEEDLGYSPEDFEYLQGVKTGKNRWEGHRIEIDAIHAQHGIRPFVNYMLHKIQAECKVWDLSRIGLEPFELEDAPDHYEKVLNSHLAYIKDAFNEKYIEITNPRNNIIQIIKRIGSEGEEKWRTIAEQIWVEAEHEWYAGLKHPEITELWKLYEDDRLQDWRGPYEDDLETLNGTITKYEGDVRKGIDDLSQQFVTLQETVYEDADTDTELGSFSESLEGVDWGEDQLEEIEAIPELQLVDMAIQALQERRKALMEATQ